MTPQFKSIIDSDPNTEFLMRARATVAEVLETARTFQGTRRQLFLEWHYPFFDADVQGLLMKRHPKKDPKVKLSPEFAIHAYLWAEQYSWIAYGDELMKNTKFVDEQASFFMANDLLWFTQLVSAIARVVEKYYRYDPAAVTHEQRIQAWCNEHGESEKEPTKWLEGTRFRSSNGQERKDSMPSIRVTATKVNKKRRELFESWRPCWEAELRLLDEILAFPMMRRT